MLCLCAIPGTAEAQRAKTLCAPFASTCALPFPNDMRLTDVDRSTPTGVRVALESSTLPANKDGRRVSATAINRADGFSPGQQIIVRVPGVDRPGALRRSKAPTLDDIGSYTARDAGVLVLDAKTGRRHPIWVEVDMTVKRPSERTLLIHPAKNFAYGRNYVVVLRNLRRANGRRIAAPRGLAVEAALGYVRSTLRRARVRQRDVYLAWDFTVASERSLHGPLLKMRDESFAALGDRDLADRRVEGASPAFTVTSVDRIPGDDRFARRVRGTFTVPCYLQGAGCPAGSAFNARRDGLPVQRPGNVAQPEFECIVPARSLSEPARIMQYGHGLLGDESDISTVDNVRTMAADHNFVTCATPWAGFSAEDVPYAIQVLNDVSKFPGIADRMQQGILNQLHLGRLLVHPQGLISHPALQGTYDPSELFYDGNSQGGIQGPALTAVAPDFQRAVWGAAGMNYSVLLTRSVDFDLYSRIFFPAYPVQADRTFVLALIQLLWDRGEANGWAAKATTDPPPNTPPHTALIHAIVGDEEVSTYTADALARTAGASVRRPAFGPGRSLERAPAWGIPQISAFPFAGSALVYWDAGAEWNGTSPIENRPPRTGRRAHYTARNTPEAQRQKSEFLRRGGSVVETCPPGAPCPATRTETS